MKLTIIAPEMVYEHEVDSSMQVQDIIALVEAETGMPSADFTLSNDSGVQLNEPDRSLDSYGLKGDATIFISSKQETAQSSQAGPSSAVDNLPNSDSELERMRLQALGNSHIMSEIRRNDPELASAFETGGQRFKDAYAAYQSKVRQAMTQKAHYEQSLNDDPYDVEAQKRIEEAIRMQAVEENMAHAMEYSPEAFGNVHMLYINVEVNGHPVKAFVDSGAQSTIISPACAEACGIMRLVDSRFAGMAVGVGTAKILGRIHSAQIRLGNLHLPCSFSVLEGTSVDLLFGLDMLKRHQCNIDLSTNTLRINNTEVPFLSEHELPEKARKMGQPEEDPGAGAVAGPSSTPAKTEFPGSGQPLGAKPASVVPPAAATASKPAIPTFPEAHIESLTSFGVTRDQAIQLLEAAGGNVDVAASMMFG